MPRIAYFINQYPKVSHSFIRREILALERQGTQVQRIALRGWNDEIVDPEDMRERDRTHYVLQGGAMQLLTASFQAMVSRPLRFARALRLALKMAGRAERPLPYHLIYLAEACRILPWLESSGTTHMHAHFGTNPAEVVMLAHALSGLPYSFTVHGPEEFDKPEFIGLPEKIRRAAFVVAISSFGKSQLFRWIGHDAWDKIKVVHCGLDLDAFDHAPPAPADAPRLVCVGRLCEQKGQLLLIEAAQALALKGVRFELVLAGDGEMRAELESLIVKYGLKDRVSITGWLTSEQVRKELQAARALVLPSFAEGLPVVIMESMAMGRPVLTTAIAGIPELVQDGRHGWLFSAGALDELVHAIEACLRATPAELECMGTMCRESVRERHDIDREAAKLLALFRNSAVEESAIGAGTMIIAEEK